MKEMIKEEWIEKLEENNQKMTIVERNNYLLVEITSENGKATFVNGESNIHHEIKCHMYGKVKINEKDILAIFSWFEKKFSHKPCLVNIDSAYIAKEWEKFLINALRKGGYNQYTHFRKKLQMFTKYKRKQIFFSKTSPKKEINNYFHYNRKLMDVLKENYQKHPLFDYKIRDGNFYDQGFSLDIERYYCKLKLINTRHGVKILMLDADEEEKIIEMFEITEEKNFKTILQAFIDDKLKKQRIRTITDPSDYHFQNFCFESKIFKMYEKIYQELLAYYSPQEIEKKAAVLTKNEQSEKKELKNGFYLSEFDEKAIITNEETKQIFIIENNEYLNQNIENVLKNIS